MFARLWKPGVIFAALCAASKRGLCFPQHRFASLQTRRPSAEHLVSGFRPPRSRLARFHTCNIHEKRQKVNANHQFVILFVHDASIIALFALWFVDYLSFDTGFLLFFSILLHFGYNSGAISYKTAFISLRRLFRLRPERTDSGIRISKIRIFSQFLHISAYIFA